MNNDLNPWVAGALIVVVAAIGIGIAWWVTGGDVACMFANDPAMCAAVREDGK